MQNLGLYQDSTDRRRFQSSEEYRNINSSITSNNRLMNLVRNTAQGTQKRIETALQGLIAENNSKALPWSKKNLCWEKSDTLDLSVSRNS